MASGATATEEHGRPIVAWATDAHGICEVRLQRQHARNAVHDAAYEGWMEALRAAEADSAVKVVLLTGEGKFFCTGADLEAGFDPSVGPLKSRHGSLHDPVGRFMSAVIRFPKPIVAAVNGPAVGVGCTVLPHCDIVIAADSTYFWCPFTDLCVTPEFCSSVTFPEILGPSLANELLLFGARMSPSQALAAGFVSAVLPAGDDFVDKVKARLKPALAAHNAGRSLQLFKRLQKDDAHIARMEGIHRREMALLDLRCIGPDSESKQALSQRFAAAKAKAAAKTKAKL